MGKIALFAGVISICCLLLIKTCINHQDKSKTHFLATFKMCEGLYVEKYQTPSRFYMASEEYADYLTDSVNFTIFVDTYNENENITYYCKEDSIYIRKISLDHSSYEYPIKAYSLTSLKKEKKTD